MVAVCQIEPGLSWEAPTKIFLGEGEEVKSTWPKPEVLVVEPLISNALHGTLGLPLMVRGLLTFTGAGVAQDLRQYKFTLLAFN